jgi:iron complex transport system substrate-binding protein
VSAATPLPAPVRVVSLIASATEIVCALGAEAMLVGRSHECDFPPSVRTLPQVSRPAFATAGTSRATDLAVRERLAKALSIYEVDAELLRTLKPDVILAQTQCAVCAVTPADVERAVCQLTDRAVTVVACEPNRLGDVWEDVRRIAQALGIGPDGDRLVDRLRRRVLDIGAKAAGLYPKPKLAVIEWMDPLMTAGNWMPELIEVAGGSSVLGVAGEHSPRLTWDQLALKDPDVILVSPCGYDIARTRQEWPALASQRGWQRLRAVKAGKVALADGNAWFHRPGPRLVESLEILAELLHPKAFHFGYEGRGWEHV